MRKGLRRLKGYTGRVLRDIQRQLDAVADAALRKRIEDEIALTDRLLRQKPKDKRKLYALHESAVDCISKGKARAGGDPDRDTPSPRSRLPRLPRPRRRDGRHLHLGPSARFKPSIGHMETDGRPKGTLGNALDAVLCGCSHNVRMILAHLRALVTEILRLILRAIAAVIAPVHAKNSGYTRAA